MKITDTSPEAQRVQMEIYRGMSVAKKVRLHFDAYHMGQMLAMAGIRMRNPSATEEEVWHEWARGHLGDELYNAAYGTKNNGPKFPAKRAISESKA